MLVGALEDRAPQVDVKQERVDRLLLQFLLFAPDVLRQQELDLQRGVHAVQGLVPVLLDYHHLLSQTPDERDAKRGCFEEVAAEVADADLQLAVQAHRLLLSSR